MYFYGNQSERFLLVCPNYSERMLSKNLTKDYTVTSVVHLTEKENY